MDEELVREFWRPMEDRDVKEFVLRSSWNGLGGQRRGGGSRDNRGETSIKPLFFPAQEIRGDLSWMLLRGMGMDLEEIRELEEEIRRLWVEIPRERMRSRHDIKHVDKEYILHGLLMP